MPHDPTAPARETATQSSKTEQGTNAVGPKGPGLWSAWRRPSKGTKESGRAGPAVEGNIDVVSDREIAGWAWMPSNPAQRLTAEIRIDEVAVARVKLDTFRQDLAAAGIGDGAYSFSVKYEPGPGGGGRTRRLDLRILESDFRFAGFPRDLDVAPIQDEFEGFVDFASPDSLAGWARKRGADAEIVTVEIVAGDEVVRSARADIERGDVSAHPHGFRFDLGDLTTHELKALQSGSIGVRIAGGGALLPVMAGADPSVLRNRLRAPRYETEVRMVQGRIIEGTVIDRIDPHAPVEVKALLDDQTELPEIEIGRRVMVDLDGKGHSLPCGFRLELPEHVLDGDRHEIRLTIAGDIEMPGGVFVVGATEGESAVASFVPETAAIDRPPLPARTIFPAWVGRLVSNDPKVRATATVPPKSADWPAGLSVRDSFVGFAEAEAGCRVRGFAIDLATPGQPVPIDVLVDGNLWWRGEAKRLWTIGLAEGSCRVAAGFSVDLPPPTPERSRWRVEIRRSADSLPLTQPLVVDAADRFVGYVEKIAVLDDGQIAVEGWVHDSAEPFSWMDVHIVCGNRILATSTADRYRGDLRDAGVGMGNHGFHAIVPKLEFETSDLSVVIPATGKTLPRSEPTSVADTTPAPSASTVPALPDLSVFIEGGVTGHVDRWGIPEISGWARAIEGSDQPIQLDLLVDNHLYASTFTSIFRRDLQQKFGDHGYHGFHFEFPPNYRPLHPLRFEIVPRNIGGRLENAKRTLFERDAGAIGNAGADTVVVAREIYRAPILPAEGARQEPLCALIVLNRDGESLLESFFESFDRYNRYTNYEIIIIDHGSVDDSEAICRRWSEKLNVKYIARGRNFTFSESNNYGARLTAAEYLYFVNNDVTFLHDFIASSIEFLRDPAVGMLGFGLLDQPLGRNGFSPPLIQHLGVHYSPAPQDRAVHPIETRYQPHLHEVHRTAWKVPTVTGAFLACRHEDFDALGGFDEKYNYGYEDVDLCLGTILRLGKEIVSANHLCAYHLRGYSRKKSGVWSGMAMLGNRRVLERRYGYATRRRQREDLLSRPGYWSASAPRIAFAVTEASDTTAAGDYFTAKELAEQLIALTDVTIVYLEEDKSWYDLQGIDVLIVMRHEFDPAKITNAGMHLLKVAWARNWIEQWAERASDYDLVWASSDKAADHIRDHAHVPVETVSIATNAAAFASAQPSRSLKSDYCFTGSFWGHPRDIMYKLEPAALPFDFAVFGHGWDQVPSFAPYYRGPLPYSRMAEVYASTRIVIDDANSVTKQWGSVNSRVYDAIASGALVITNGVEGARAQFKGLLPTYGTRQELETLLWHYLRDENARRALVEDLRREVLGAHTYAHRARQVFELLKDVGRSQLRIAIKIGAPNEKVRDTWGDYHFSLALKKAFRRRGHSVRIDCLDAWNDVRCLGDDVVLVLRGLSRYEPKSHQINLAWVISHPNELTVSEFEHYDHVFVASRLYAADLAKRIAAPVTPLLQCTDPDLFHDSVEPPRSVANVLFVGNSRNVFRPIVKDAYAAGLDISVYGNGWQPFLPDQWIVAEYLPNRELASHYRHAGVVLNDHWEDMRANGFVSNRLFDCVAAGARVVSDEVVGLQELFGDLVATYSRAEDLPRVIEAQQTDSDERRAARAELAARIRREHSFEARAAEIMRVVEGLDGQKRTLGAGKAETA